MAVGVEFLGQQVRCPHCQQVVIAPAVSAPAPFPPPEPAPDFFPRLRESEDIFSQPSNAEDALFGQEEPPRLEIPSEPAPTPAPAPPLERSGAANGHSDRNLPELSPVAAESPPQPAFTSTEPAEAPAPQSPAWSPAAAGDEGVSSLAAARARRAQEASRSLGGTMFILLVFLPVLLWALGATAIGIWLYVNLLDARRRSDPFEAIPDTDGDTPGVRKPGMKTRGVLQTTLGIVTQPLPEHLRVRLKDKEPIRIGALEVTPTRIARQRMSIMVEKFDKAEPLETDSLVLYLKIRNLAEDYAFTPLDNFFDRQWKRSGPPPYTLLEAGSQTFIGGPAAWVSETQARSSNKSRREWIAGRKNIDRAGLQPGEEEETFTCTDGSDPKIARFLFGVDTHNRRVQTPYRGPLLWRVQLRRGLIDWRGKRVPATAVIGVEFTDKDYAG
jgi:hypothetical protein